MQSEKERCKNTFYEVVMVNSYEICFRFSPCFEQVRFSFMYQVYSASSFNY